MVAMRHGKVGIQTTLTGAPVHAYSFVVDVKVIRVQLPPQPRGALGRFCSRVSVAALPINVTTVWKFGALRD